MDTEENFHTSLQEFWQKGNQSSKGEGAFHLQQETHQSQTGGFAAVGQGEQGWEQLQPLSQRYGSYIQASIGTSGQ